MTEYLMESNEVYIDKKVKGKEKMSVKRKMLASMIATLMIVSLTLQPVLASVSTPVTNEQQSSEKFEDEEGVQKKSEKIVVTQFSKLQEDILVQIIEQGSDEVPVLPEVLEATSEGGVTVEIEVGWTAATALDNNIKGEYTYLPTIKDEKYSLIEGVEAPSILIKVEPSEKEIDIKETAGDGGDTPAEIETYAGTGNQVGVQVNEIGFVYEKDTENWDYSRDVANDTGYEITITDDGLIDECYVTVDINPYDIEEFPLKISHDTLDIISSQISESDIIRSQDKTALTIKVEKSDIPSGGLKFNIYIAPERPTTYHKVNGTFAAEIGNILVDNPSAQFGVGVAVGTEQPTEFTEFNTFRNKIPHTLSFAGMVKDGLITGQSVMKGSIDNQADATEAEGYSISGSGIGGLYLASNGEIYFRKSNTVGSYYSEDSYFLKYNFLELDHFPVSDFTYSFYGGTDNSETREPSLAYMGLDVPLNGSNTGYKDVEDFSPMINTNITESQGDLLEGSLVKTAGLTPYIYHALTSIAYGNYYDRIGFLTDKSIRELHDLDVDYYESEMSQISYKQYKEDEPITYDIGKIRVNIPEYTFVDYLTASATAPSRVHESDVDEQYEFSFRNSLDSKAYQSDFAMETYPDGKLTLTMPEHFEPTTLSIHEPEGEFKRYDPTYGYSLYPTESFTGYTIHYSDGKAAKHVELGEPTFLPGDGYSFDGNERDYYFTISGLDKSVASIDLHIGSEGIGEGIEKDNRMERYEFTGYFTGTFSDPGDEAIGAWSKQPEEKAIKIDVSVTAEGETEPVGGIHLEDMDLWWIYKGPEILDNLYVSVESAYDDRGDWNDPLFLNNEQGIDVSSVILSQQTSTGDPTSRNSAKSAPGDSIVYEDVLIDVASEEGSHLELISEVVLYEKVKINSSISSRYPDIVNGEIWATYSTNEQTDIREKLEPSGSFDGEYVFTVPEGQYLTELSFEVEELQLKVKGSNGEEYNRYTFMEFKYERYREVSDGETPISTESTRSGEDGKVLYEDDLMVTFIPSNTVGEDGEEFVQKERYGDTRTTYFLYADVDEVARFGVEKAPIIPDNGTIGTYLPKGNTIEIYNNYVTSRNGSGEVYPEGSAIYLKMNPAFAYTGNDPKIAIITDNNSEIWLKYDISGTSLYVQSNRNPIIELDANDFFAQSLENHTLFSDSYIDLGPIIAEDGASGSFIDYRPSSDIAVDEVENIWGIAEENAKLYPLAITPGMNPEDQEVTVGGGALNTLSITPRMIRADGAYIIGGIGSGTANVNYYANESKSLILGMHLYRTEAYAKYELTIDLPESEERGLKLVPRDSEEVRNSIKFPEEWENPTDVTYDEINGEVVVQFESGIPDPVENSTEYIALELMAIESDVYSKEDGAQSDITVSHEYTIGTTVSSPVETKPVRFTFEWYELGGLGFVESSLTKDGIYDDGEELMSDNDAFVNLPIINKTLLGGQVGKLTWSEDGKYAIKIQPSEKQYELLLNIDDKLKETYKITDYNIEELQPLNKNNNLPQNEGIKFVANIEKGLSVEGIAGQNLTQEELDDSMVDIGLYAVKAEVIFKDVDGEVDIDNEFVNIGDTVNKTTEELSDKEAQDNLEGWYVDDNGNNKKDEDEKLWSFKGEEGSIPVVEDTVLKPYVKWPVDFEKPANKDEILKSDKVQNNEKVTKPTEEELKGELEENETIKGWFEDVDNDGVKDDNEPYWEFDKTVVTKPTILTPHVVESHTVIFDDKDFGGEIHSKVNKIPKGDTVNPPSYPPLNEGKVPVKWFEDLNNNGKYDEGETWNFLTPIERDVILHPYYEFTVTFEKEDGKTPHEEKVVPEGETLNPPTNPPTSDKNDPQGWFEDKDNDGVKDPEEDFWDFEKDVVNKDTTLTPYYEYIVRVFESHASDDGSGTYEAGELVTLDAGTLEGSRFIGWTVTFPGGKAIILNMNDPMSLKTTFIMPNANVDITANWEREIPEPTPEPTPTPEPEPTPTPTPTPTPEEGPIILPEPELQPETEDEIEEEVEPESEEDQEEVPATIPLPEVDEENSAQKVEVGDQILDENDYSIDEDGNLILSPEFIKTLPDGEHRIRITINEEIYETVMVVEDGVPLSMGVFERVGGAWSLFDLIMTILAVLFAVGYTVIRPRERKDEENEELGNEEEEERKHKKRLVTSGALALLAIFNIILFILTQDLTQPMIIFDIYSIVFAIVVIAQVIIMYFIRKKNDEEDDGESKVVAN